MRLLSACPRPAAKRRAGKSLVEHARRSSAEGDASWRRSAVLISGGSSKKNAGVRTMLRTSPISKLLSVLLAPLALASVAARADVVIEETMNTDGVAGFSMLAMQGTTTRSLSADKSRTDSNLQFKSKFLNTFAGKNGNTSQIVRLDKGVMWDVQLKDKTYTERTFADARAALEKAMQQMEAAS